MDTGTKIGALAAGALIVFACSMFVVWQAVQKEQTALREKIGAAEQQVRDANARQDSRKTELDKRLAQLVAQKKKVQTPAEVIEALPGVLALPKPIRADQALLSPSAVNGTRQAQQPKPGTPLTGEKAEPPQPSVSLPVEDLKPLYDFSLGCQACQAQLATAQGDLKDEKAKTAALSRERDSALQAARGGSVLKRVVRAAKWFAIGAAAGAVAVKLAH